MLRLSEEHIRLFFDLSLIVKGIFAAFEMLAGAAALFVSQELLVRLATALTADELGEDPRDVVAHYLLVAAEHYSLGAKYFTVLYLLSHGAIKLWLIVGLLRKRLWYYPTAMVIFFLFITYQLYEYFFASHSVLLIVLTVLDLIVIALTWHEWQYLRKTLEKNIDLSTVRP